MNKEIVSNILSSFATVAQTPSEEEQQRLSEAESQLRKEITTLPDTFLPNEWVFFLDTNQTEGPRNISRGAYLKSLRQSAAFSTVKSICEYAAEACERTGKVMLFKQGIKPIWEDRNNFNGGRFHLCCVDKQQTLVSFVTMLAYMFTASAEDSLIQNEELCGIVCSLRAGSLGVEVWNKSAKKKEKVKATRKALKKLFKRNILYYVHRTSVNINKFGIDAVMPVIEKEKEEREQRRKENNKVSQPSKVELQLKEVSATPAKERQVLKSCQQEANVVDALSTALLSAALANAWNSHSA